MTKEVYQGNIATKLSNDGNSAQTGTWPLVRVHGLNWNWILNRGSDE